MTKLGKFVVLIFFLAHTCACGWMLVANLEKDQTYDVYVGRRQRDTVPMLVCVRECARTAHGSPLCACEVLCALFRQV